MPWHGRGTWWSFTPLYDLNSPFISEELKEDYIPLARKYSTKALASKDLKVCEKNFAKAKKLLALAEEVGKENAKKNGIVICG